MKKLKRTALQKKITSALRRYIMPKGKSEVKELKGFIEQKMIEIIDFKKQSKLKIADQGEKKNNGERYTDVIDKTLHYAIQ